MRTVDHKTIEEIKKARNINEILTVLKKIGRSIKQHAGTIDRILEAVSNTSISAKAPNDIELEVLSPRKKLEFVRTDDVKKIPLSEFKQPNGTLVQKHLKDIDALYSHTLELQTAEAIILQNFSKLGTREQALKQVRLLIEEAAVAINKGLKAVNLIARKHVPAELKTLVNSVKRHLEKTLDPKAFNGLIEPYLYIAYPDEKKGHFLFQYYIPLDGLMDTEGYQYEEYIIVLTGLINVQGQMAYHITTLPTFQTPGSFDIGRPVESQSEALRRVSTLISRDNVLVRVDRKELGTDTPQASKALGKIKYVHDVRVLNKSLFLFLSTKTTPQQINDILTQALPIIYSLVGLRRKNKSALKYSVKNTRKGQKVLEFILTPNQQRDEYTTNLAKLGELRDLLDLSPELVKQVKQALKTK